MKPTTSRRSCRVCLALLLLSLAALKPEASGGSLKAGASGRGSRAPAGAPCGSGKLQYLNKSDGQMFLGKTTDKPGEFITCNCGAQKIESGDELKDTDDKCEGKSDPNHVPPGK